MLTDARQRGFNLIEAVVTVSVLGILIAAAVPGMGDWIRATHVRNVAETTQNGLQKARTEAMKRNKVVTFWLVSPANAVKPDNTCALSPASAAWVISLDDPAGKCATDPSSTTLPRIVETYGPGQAANGVTVSALDGAGAAASSISFNGFGQRVGAGVARIDITHDSGPSVRPLRIQVSSSGGVRMCDPAVAAPDPRACT